MFQAANRWYGQSRYTAGKPARAAVGNPSLERKDRQGKAMSNELAKRIDSMIGRFEREDVNMHGFILSVNGKRKAEAYYAPFKKHAPHRMYSVSKTFTGIAVGMLISDGLLNLDDRICTWFSDWLPENPDGRLTRLTRRPMCG